MTPDFKYKNITIHPHWGEFVIENGIFLILIPIALLALGLKEFPFRWVCYGILLIMALYLLYRYQYLVSMKYNVGDEQLMIQSGIVAQRCDYIEMYRIVDYNETRTVLQRLFGLKTVTVFSGDRTSPQLPIRGVPKNLDLVSIIRERVEYNKLRKGVHELTNL